ncbi:MAG: DNA-3-methyladenine glycosylase [Bacteroidales bacterium]|nr:DNA-3-methyladenine glycosylase [Bacteroidales bacterium]
MKAAVRLKEDFFTADVLDIAPLLPGKLTRHLGIDGSFYGEDISVSERIWIEDGGCKVDIDKGRRIGIDYAGTFWRDIEWRYYVR